MSWWQNLFGKPHSDALGRHATKDQQVRVSETGRVARVRDLNFAGISYSSSDKRFRMILKDSFEGRGGYRRSGNGQFMLLRDDVPVYRGEMERPSDGCVANSGHVIIADWGFGDELRSTIYVISPSFEKLVEHRLDANSTVVGISDCGQIAACHTANAPNFDGNKFTVFDTKNGTVICCCELETGWPSSFGFDIEADLVHLNFSHPVEESFSITTHGDFVDREKWINAELGRGNLRLAMKLLGESVPLNEKRKSGAQRAANVWELLSEKDSNNFYDAGTWRLHGEIMEILDDLPKAMRSFNIALSLDPKVGVKRKLAAMTRSGIVSA
jgi:hypothetical protein